MPWYTGFEQWNGNSVPEDCTSFMIIAYEFPHLLAKWTFWGNTRTSIMIEDISIQNDIQTIGQHVTKLKEKGMLAQMGPLGFKIHKIQPGDGVFIKSWKEETLTPKWEGLYLTLLTTDTSVRTAKKGWTHTSKVKEPVEPPMATVENHLTAQGSTNNLGKEGQVNVKETS
ncbi:hypothetical protein DUI87_20825 [Hirundo rustica rustica]|uniref:Murine leukemia virus integrase C-terminal domain-containing protein n=1 Tax=Hirundo rustica rustica TaxID=333673 RepID=A0A3M0JN93_HIRRU|nr:hypothetical protein DUI87_20825 [Hirundo rustica rustica]